MRIAYAIPVRHAEALKTGDFLAVGIESTRVAVRDLPATVNVVLLVCVAAPPHEVGEQCSVEVRVLGPDLAPATPPLNVRIRLAAGPQHPPGWDIRAVFPMTVQVPVNELGCYSIEIACEGDASLSIPLLVAEPLA
jgi:hypothetical protein